MNVHRYLDVVGKIVDSPLTMMMEKYGSVNIMILILLVLEWRTMFNFLPTEK